MVFYSSLSSLSSLSSSSYAKERTKRMYTLCVSSSSHCTNTPNTPNSASKRVVKLYCDQTFLTKSFDCYSTKNARIERESVEAKTTNGAKRYCQKCSKFKPGNDDSFTTSYLSDPTMDIPNL